MFLATWRGLGITGDDVTPARTSNGHGLSIESRPGDRLPLVTPPPLYPSVLPLVGTSGVDPIVAARWVNALFFGANILLVGLLIKRYVGKRTGISLLGAMLILTSVDMLYIHSFAMSEPAFIFLGLLGLWLIDACSEQ